MLSGFVKRSSGSVSVDGEDLLKIAINRRAIFGIRRTFQQEQVVENLTVWNNVAAALDNLSTGVKSRKELIGDALNYVGLSSSKDQVGFAPELPAIAASSRSPAVSLPNRAS